MWGPCGAVPPTILYPANSICNTQEKKTTGPSTKSRRNAEFPSISREEHSSLSFLLTPDRTRRKPSRKAWQRASLPELWGQLRRVCWRPQPRPWEGRSWSPHRVVPLPLSSGLISSTGTLAASMGLDVGARKYQVPCPCWRHQGPSWHFLWQFPRAVGTSMVSILILLERVWDADLAKSMWPGPAPRSRPQVLPEPSEVTALTQCNAPRAEVKGQLVERSRQGRWKGPSGWQKVPS